MAIKNATNRFSIKSMVSAFVNNYGKVDFFYFFLDWTGCRLLKLHVAFQKLN